MRSARTANFQEINCKGAVSGALILQAPWIGYFPVSSFFASSIAAAYSFLLTADSGPAEGLRRGLQYYLGHFFEAGEIPRYYDVRRDPVDSTAAAQSLLTLIRFGEVGRARAVALWMIAHMQDPQGFFYYQRRRAYTIRTPYMRWSNAWMLAGLAALWECRNDLV